MACSDAAYQECLLKAGSFGDPWRSGVFFWVHMEGTILEPETADFLKLQLLGP